LSGELHTCGKKVYAVELLDKFDYVACYPAATTVEHLLFDIDTKAIVAAALRTRTDKFKTLAP
jgi:hypothetical protein